MQPVDLRHVDLDAIVSIEKGKILLYPTEPSQPPAAEASGDASTASPAPAAEAYRAASAASPARSGGSDSSLAATKPRKMPKTAATSGQAMTAQATPGQASKGLAAASLDAATTKVSVDAALPHGAPPRGTGLNVPALLTFRRMVVKDRGNAAAVTKFRAKLEAHAAKIGAVFVHYDAETGTWIMKVDGF